MTHTHESDRKFTVSVTSPGQCKRVLALDIPQDEVDREKETVAKDLRRRLKVPGFRPGKVPLAFIWKNYAEMIEADAVRNLLPHVYGHAVEQEGLRPLDEPRFENLKTGDGDGIHVDALIEVRPEITLTGYSAFTIEVHRRDISDENVDQTLADLRERMAAFEDVDRQATSSDYVTIDYAPYLESGEIDEASRQKEHPVDMSSEQLLEEFRLGLIGMAKDAEKDLTVKYPDDFAQTELAGKERRFHVRVVGVKEKLLPELDDAFAKRVADADSMDALRKRILKDMNNEEDRRYRREVDEKVIGHLVEANPFEVPEVMAENYLSSLIEEDRGRRPHVTDEAQRETEIRKLFSEAAVRSIKKYFILDAVKAQENLTVSDEEIEAKMQSLADEAGKNVGELKEFLKSSDRRRRFEDDLLDAKAFDLLRGNATIKGA